MGCRTRDRQGLESEADVTAECLPVTFDVARTWGQAHLIGAGALTIHVGLADGTDHIRLEARGQNRSGDLADNAGNTGGVDTHERIDPDGPEVRKTALDLLALRDAIAAEDTDGVTPPALISQDAGAYVCNAILYHSLGCSPDGRVVFIHVPMVDEVRAALIGTVIARAIRTAWLDSNPPLRA